MRTAPRVNGTLTCFDSESSAVLFGQTPEDIFGVGNAAKFNCTGFDQEEVLLP